MLLAIDIGNTNIVLGLYQGKKLITHWRLATQAERTAEGTVGDALDRPAPDGGQRHGDDQHRDQRQDEKDEGRRRGEADGDGRDQRHEGADHEDVAMGEVDHADDPVDHRIADRDQPVDRA